MNFSNKPKRWRKAGTQPLQAVVHRRNVVRDFLHIRKGNAGHFVVLVHQKVGERGLSSFDLRGQHCFFANVGVDKQRQVRKVGG